jgi:hypothetical protein
MIKGIMIAAAMALVVALAVPAIAAAQGADTSVTVATGGGTNPIVKCKWEQDLTAELEDGDPGHATPGSQFLPPGMKCGLKTICYYAVVTDEEDGGNVSQVYVDVYHPVDAVPPYSCSTDPRGPYFKYEIPMTNIGHDAAAVALLEAAAAAGLVTFDPAYTLEEIITQELMKGTADLWYGCAEIDYEQPCGMYDVKAFAIDRNSNISAVLENQFEYVCVPIVEIDFTSFTYGSVNLGVEKMVAGDTVWTDPAGNPAGAGQTAKATIRNVGNSWARPVIMQDDMGFGKDITGMWNVSFDARMGNDDAYKVYYDPEVATPLLNYLDLSTLEELDLSILIKKGVSGSTYTGAIVIEAECVPFVPYNCDGTGKPDGLVGIPDPC